MSGITFASNPTPVAAVEPKPQEPVSTPDAALANAMRNFKWDGEGDVNLVDLSNDEGLRKKFEDSLPEDVKADATAKLKEYVDAHKLAEESKGKLNDPNLNLDKKSKEYTDLYYNIEHDLDHQITIARIQHPSAANPPDWNENGTDKLEKLTTYCEKELGLSKRQLDSIKDQLTFTGKDADELSHGIARFVLHRTGGDLPALTTTPAAPVAPPSFEMGPDDKSATLTKGDHKIEVSVGADGHPKAVIHTKNKVVDDQGKPVLTNGKETYKIEDTTIDGDIGVDGSITFNLASSGIQLRIDTEKVEGKPQIARVEISADGEDNHVLTADGDKLKVSDDKQGAFRGLPTVHVTEIAGQQAAGKAGWKMGDREIADFAQLSAPAGAPPAGAPPAESPPPGPTSSTGPTFPTSNRDPNNPAGPQTQPPAGPGPTQKEGETVTKEENAERIRQFFCGLFAAVLSGNKDTAKVEGYFDVTGDLKTEFFSIDVGALGLGDLFGPPGSHAAPAPKPKEPVA